MNFLRLKRWMPLVALMSGLWLTAYVVFWLDRANCAGPTGACLANAFGNWLGDVVMLSWVKSYQELLGGIAALIAASVVVWTALTARRNELHDREQMELGALKLAIEKLRRRWVRVSFLLDVDATDEKIRAELSLIHDVAERLPSSAYDLAFSMMIAVDGIDGYLDDIAEDEAGDLGVDPAESNAPDEIEPADADEDCDPRQEIGKIVFSVTAFFYGHKRLTNGATYQHSLREMDEEDIEEAAESGLTAENQDALSRMFVWFPSNDQRSI